MDAKTARQVARTAARAATHTYLARTAQQAASGQLGALTGAPERVPRPVGPLCSTCSAELDPDRTCFVCRDGIVQAEKAS